MEYSDLYADVNQVSLRFQQTEFSEVMVVHRMYVRLLDLDMTTEPHLQMLPGSEKVRRLYVVADVVELPARATNMRLPATVSVVILCRMLYVQDVNSPFLTCGLHFPLMPMRVVEDTQQGRVRLFPVVGGSASVDVNNEIGLYIHADRVVYRQDTNTVDPLQPLQLRVIGNGSTFSTEVRPDWPKTLEVSNLIMWLTLSKGQPIPAAESDLQRHDEVELLPPPSPDRLSVVFSYLAPGNLFNIVVDVEYGGAGFSYFRIPPADPVPTEVLTDPYVITGLQMNMLIAELVLAAHNSPPVISVVTKHVEWLNKILQPKLSLPNDDILALLFRVQAFLKMAKQPRSVVPRLQYHMYSPLINRMVQVAQVYDQEFKQLKFFIAQNQILGSYLLEQNKAFASREREMSSFHSQVVSLRRTELNNAIDRMDQLSVQMENENEAMDQAKEDMVQAIQEYEKKQLANALFAVLGAIASVALAFATAGATAPGAVAAAGAAVSAAGRLAEGLKKVVEILEGLAAVMEIVAAIRDLVESLQNLGQLVETPEMPDMPSNADWLIFVNEVVAVAEQMPAEVVGSVAVWKAKCKNVAVLGQEMCTTAAHIGELTHQIKVEEMLQEIAQRQANRLESLTPANLSSYTEMLSQIDMRTTRLLLQLIRLLHIQNAAIKYEYLYAAGEQLNSWPVSMDTVWSMLLQQENSALVGLLDLGPSNDFTRSFVVKGIPVGLLVDGNDWQFSIPVEDSPTFPIGYSRVRIRYVELRFDQGMSDEGRMIHQPSTSSGLTYMLLQSSRVFRDRRRREVLEYEASMGLAYAFAYNLTTGVPTLTNVPSPEFANTFMRMTPFNSNWRLRLSSSAAENQGLMFPTASSADDTTQISVTFFISAIRGIDTRAAIEI